MLTEQMGRQGMAWLQRLREEMEWQASIEEDMDGADDEGSELGMEDGSNDAAASNSAGTVDEDNQQVDQSASVDSGTVADIADVPVSTVEQNTQAPKRKPNTNLQRRIEEEQRLVNVVKELVHFDMVRKRHRSATCLRGA